MTVGPLLGVSFSHRYAAWLGLDPYETLRALLTDVGVRYLRLSVYWDEIAPEPSRLAFDPLRPWLELAATEGARVTITLGLKAQRHPEFYPPRWLWPTAPPSGAALDRQPRLVTLLLLMLERVTAFLADYDVIEAWQVENQPFVPAAGRTVGWRISPALLAREIEVVREVDPRRRPIVVTHASATALDGGWRDALALADILGQDVYTRVPAPRGLPWRYWNRYAWGPLAPNLRAQARAARRLGRGWWITELQAEPWERGDIRQVPPTAVGSVSPERIVANLALARRSRPQRILLWGAEWWRFAAERQGDRRYWDLARALFRGGP
jgi:hypothetical protein